MRNKLTAIKTWKCPKEVYGKPKYKDENGNYLNGIYSQEFKKTIHVKFISSGYPCREYLFLKKDAEKITFRSKMVNFENLNLCGGWGMNDGKKSLSDEHVAGLNRVITGKKPVVQIIADEEDMPKLKEKAKKHGLGIKIKFAFIDQDGNNYRVYIYRQGKFGDLFDMDAWGRTWSEVYWFGDEFEKFVDKLKNTEMGDVVSDNLVKPETDLEFILTGLCFGYAIESTLSCLKMEW